ncbi:hypothetical protein LUW75_22950 [Streptomyces sp. MRC013]|uniref:hypothetical protein n=1 Tax=Streptomyces sp. MRC013 TaxID=2898276 RepID=UPI0020265984|nr:hypothetical protein [Streptomyces sp. MRC013]URM92340.1 hypothetical protein LUW75_22950 [Streptomyces sp. MRC013]
MATLDHRVQLLAAGVLGLTAAALLAVTGRPRPLPPAGTGAGHRPQEAGAAKTGRAGGTIRGGQARPSPLP